MTFLNRSTMLNKTNKIITLLIHFNLFHSFLTYKFIPNIEPTSPSPLLLHLVLPRHEEPHPNVE